MSDLSFKIPDVKERLRKDSTGRTLSSNLVYTIWAVFGGFILHFLLSNYLTVLLKPNYEEPVDTAANLINRNIVPFAPVAGDTYYRILADSTDPIYQEISRKLVIAKDWDEYGNMVSKVTSTGSFSMIGTVPAQWLVPQKDYKNWYRSSETFPGYNPYGVHLLNKKWPLRKVF